MNLTTSRVPSVSSLPPNKDNNDYDHNTETTSITQSIRIYQMGIKTGPIKVDCGNKDLKNELLSESSHRFHHGRRESSKIEHQTCVVRWTLIGTNSKGRVDICVGHQCDHGRTCGRWTSTDYLSSETFFLTTSDTKETPSWHHRGSWSPTRSMSTRRSTLPLLQPPRGGLRTTRQYLWKGSDVGTIYVIEVTLKRRELITQRCVEEGFFLPRVHHKRPDFRRWSNSRNNWTLMAGNPRRFLV